MENLFAPIQPISSLSSFPASAVGFGEGTRSIFEEEKEAAPSFQSMFLQALNTANDTLMTAGDLGKKLATGELKDLHDVTIAGAKAEVMLHLTTQIASKISSACTTLFQMQL